MNQKLKTLILMGVKQAGTYDPDDALTSVDELLTVEEFILASMFLRWVTVHKKTFGSKTFETVFKEFRKVVPV